MTYNVSMGIDEEARPPMSSTTSNQRLDVRLTAEHKRLIAQAAELLGQSLSVFSVSTLVREAEQVVERFERLRLSDRDRDAFLAALDHPPKPAARLRKAAEARRR